MHQRAFFCDSILDSFSVRHQHWTGTPLKKFNPPLNLKPRLSSNEKYLALLGFLSGIVTRAPKKKFCREVCDKGYNLACIISIIKYLCIYLFTYLFIIYAFGPTQVTYGRISHFSLHVGDANFSRWEGWFAREKIDVAFLWRFFKFQPSKNGA